MRTATLRRPARRGLLLLLAVALAIGLPVLRAWHLVHDHRAAPVVAAAAAASDRGDRGDDHDRCAICVTLAARADALLVDPSIPILPPAPEAGSVPGILVVAALPRPVFDRDARGPPLPR